MLNTSTRRVLTYSAGRVSVDMIVNQLYKGNMMNRV